MYVTRSEVVEQLRVKLDHLTHRDIDTVVLALEDEITRCLVAGDEVVLLGFGKFETRQRKAHSAPKHKPGASGRAAERVLVPPHRVARFVPGSKLRAAVRA